MRILDPVKCSSSFTVTSFVKSGARLNRIHARKARTYINSFIESFLLSHYTDLHVRVYLNYHNHFL